MDNLKFALFSIVIIGILIFAGYWAVSSMETGSAHIDNQKVKDLEEKKEDLEKQIADLSRENDLLKEEKKAFVDKVEDKVVETPVTTVKTTNPVKTTTTTTTTTKTTTYKYQTLINELQKLIDSNIYLKLKSSGTAVGVVQNFLVLYGSSVKVDNDYGTTTVNAVKAFQKAQKIISDGEAGSGTFSKMISWLKTKK
jgi:cell division protein FtsB